MKATLCQLLARKSLSKAECYTLFSAMEKAHLPQQSVALALLASKKESFHEIMAARDFLLEHTHCDSTLLLKPYANDLVDLVGTGGDGVATFNVSTAASLVVASCGVPVAKHGGGSITSLSGSADVIEQLQIPSCRTVQEVSAGLNKHSYAYLKAIYFNSLFQVFRPARITLGFPTIFNILGPLSNPLCPKRQVIGVYRKDLVSVVANILKETGAIHALVVYAKEGMDELSVSGPTYVAEIREGYSEEYRLDPRTLGLPKYSIDDVKGGTATENARMIKAIFDRKIKGAKRDIVLLNAAAGLYVADKVSTLAEGMQMALHAISSGKTSRLLDQLQRGEQQP